MRGTCSRRERGFTLLELTLAVAIFTVVIGVTATCLISFYSTMETEHQRVLAYNHCRSVLSDMRTIRDATPNTSDNPTAFQDALFAMYPDGVEMTGPYELSESKVIATYESTDAGTNPIVPTVAVQWNDLRGRQVTVSLSSAITDR
ncbi:MAG: prepilin-type N-terminal cleavage/methylation domain-containing protein [Nitrospiraceae bacterium]|nr:prepilin-type N-terminal cleavage/methylation domain-containing protein [Nitrospiraceae bacterium]